MIYEAIKLLFPGISDADFRLQDDGSGPYIAFWGRREPPPSMAQIEAMYPAVQAGLVQQMVVAAVQKRLDDFAKTRAYDGILSACTYSTSLVPRFRAEGQYAVEARDAHWAKAYEIMNAVLSGQRAMPTLDQTLAEMPQLRWP
jgi:hypothetical protein